MEAITLEELEGWLGSVTLEDSEWVGLGSGSEDDPTEVVARLRADRCGFLKQVKVLCHPDRYAPWSRQQVRADFLRRKVLEIDDVLQRQITDPPPDSDYEIIQLLGVGSVSRVFLTQRDGSDYVLKVADHEIGSTLLENESENLEHILSNARCGHENYLPYFPNLLKTETIGGDLAQRCNLFDFRSGLHTLEEVHAHHPVLDPRHVGWIFNRILEALGFVRRSGLVHGAMLPPHLLVDPVGHGVVVVGWGQSVRNGIPLVRGTAKYLSWYPDEVRQKRPVHTGLDLLMASRSMIYLLGGDPVNGTVPDRVPARLREYLLSFVGYGMNSLYKTDPWLERENFQDVLREVFGDPKYLTLGLS